MTADVAIANSMLRITLVPWTEYDPVFVGRLSNPPDNSTWLNMGGGS